MVEVIRFKEKQSKEMSESFDSLMLGKWHLVSDLDYTACGHATDEYNIEKKNGKVTCPDCLKQIEFFKKLRNYK